MSRTSKRKNFTISLTTYTKFHLKSSHPVRFIYFPFFNAEDEHYCKECLLLAGIRFQESIGQPSFYRKPRFTDYHITFHLEKESFRKGFKESLNRKKIRASIRDAGFRCFVR
ncbi:unnamed protein product [Amoebophrya sp. A120]|nr:unnamed protein product [Amoebophrya sp. A120]|eukprot:GSA120T00019891001.1